MYSSTEEEHLDHLLKVLELLREHQLYARISKCSFMCPELEYLRHIVGRDGLRVDPRKVRAVQTWPTPTEVHKLLAFLGLSNYIAGSYGSCGFAAATPAIPYANVTEAEVLNWCWANGLDKDATEANLAAQIALQKNPVTATGVPW